MITQIKIRNIKKFEEDDNSTIDVELSSKKINICIAPNGFGKSSIAAAFSCLRPRHLEVDEELVNDNQTPDKCSVEVVVDGKCYRSDRGTNEIGKVLNVFVIKGRTFANYKKRPTGYGKTYVRSYLDVKFIDVCKNQNKPDFKYSIFDMRKEFGKNGKILETIEPLIEYLGREDRFEEVEPIIKKFNSPKTHQKFIIDLKEKINKCKGSKQAVISEMQDHHFTDLESDQLYHDFLQIVGAFYKGETKLKIFCAFFQLINLYKDNPKSLKEMVSYSKYQFFRKNLDALMKSLNTTQKEIRTQVKNGRLVIDFPTADLLSNGQRDVMTFAAEMKLFEASICKSKKNLLIVDEVFDYLDDANTMAAQYFLSEILNRRKGEIFIVLLTHLNPEYFKNYVFSNKIINHVYLKKTGPIWNKKMMTFISFRESVKQKDEELYNKLSANLFHFHPSPEDLTSIIEKECRGKQNLKTSWGKVINFKSFLIEEVKKFFCDQQDYDPFAVAMALRFRIEKLAYDKLKTAGLKNEFIKLHTTKDKLEFCVEIGIEIPPVYFLVNSIHNEANHLKANEINSDYIKQTVGFKLENAVIKNILKQMFQFLSVEDL